MANNTQLNAMTGGDVVQTIDNTTYKTQVVAVADSTGANRIAVDANGKVPISLPTTQVTEGGVVAVGNGMVKFRDGFALQTIDAALWDTAWTNQGAGFTSFGGDSSGASYLRVTLDPRVADSQFTMTSKATFSYPFRFGYGLSLSQRIVGQECAMELVGVDGNGTIVNDSTVSLIPISGTITIATNVATINFTNPHGLKGGDRIGVVGCAYSQLNVGPVVATIITDKQITVPCVATNGTYTAGGSVYWADPLEYAYNGMSLLAENSTTTNKSFVARRNGASTRILNSTVATTIATQKNTSGYTDSFVPAADEEIVATFEDISMYSRTTDTLATNSGNVRYTVGLPDEETKYKIRFRFKQLQNFNLLKCNIVSITKTGTTTATVVTDAPHGLTTSSIIQIYGVRDQTNFPNLSTVVGVGIVDTTTFTCVIGTASSTSSAGGCLYEYMGGVSLPGAINLSIQSISRTNNILSVVVSTTSTTILPGEYGWLGGMDGAGAAYNGAYKMLRVNGTTFEFASTGADFGSITCGGMIAKLTDARIHYIRQLQYTRHLVEIANARGSNDLAKAVPVQGSVSVSSGSGLATTPNTLVADATSAALGSTNTGSALTPTSTYSMLSYEANIMVTAVSGTNPTMDVVIQESDDSGTNWYDVFHFPRITATGQYRSPPIALSGNRVRYVRTVGGSTPSFTHSVNRLQSSRPAVIIKQFFDRTILPNTTDSVTPTWFIDGITDANLIISMGAITTTAPTLVLEYSDHPAFTSSYSYQIGADITPAANVQTFIQISPTFGAYARVRVKTGGTGATLNYIKFKGIGR